jgi:hypothetical protein
MAAVVIAGLLGTGCTAQAPGPAVIVRDGGGAVLTQVPLPGGSFAVSYRNSVYGTVAEERYRVRDGGRFGLVERTLHVPGHPPVPLPPLVDGEVTVVLEVEES